MKKQILSEEFRKMQKIAGIIAESEVNNSYVVKDGDFYTIDQQKAYDYLSQFDDDDVDAETFIDDDEGWGEFEQYIDNVEELTDEELEKQMREEMSIYFFSNSDEINDPDEDQTNPTNPLDKIREYIKKGSKGNLDLANTKITSLPDNLTVGGSLSLYYTPITSLPDNLKVEGNLDLYNTPITSLPDNLTVGGTLNLINTKITSLPENLKVGGSLYLSDTPITSLPKNLTVGNYLDLRNTKITSLPKNLKVGDSLYLENTPISKQYTKEEIKQMVPGVEGKIIY
jgi:hypothetical protein